MKLLQFDESEYRMIPHNWGLGAIKFYSITFEGWKGFCLIATDSTLNIILELASNTLKNLMNIYKETHAFTHPVLAFHPDGKYYLKIGTMENEIYDSLKENRE